MFRTEDIVCHVKRSQRLSVHQANRSPIKPQHPLRLTVILMSKNTDSSREDHFCAVTEACPSCTRRVLRASEEAGSSRGRPTGARPGGGWGCWAQPALNRRIVLGDRGLSPCVSAFCSFGRHGEQSVSLSSASNRDKQGRANSTYCDFYRIWSAEEMSFKTDP